MFKCNKTLPKVLDNLSLYVCLFTSLALVVSTIIWHWGYLWWVYKWLFNNEICMFSLQIMSIKWALNWSKNVFSLWVKTMQTVSCSRSAKSEYHLSTSILKKMFFDICHNLFYRAWHANCVVLAKLHVKINISYKCLMQKSLNN